MACCSIIVKGKVQGVFFRKTGKEIAEQYNLTGWIKNTEAGYVEAKVCGDEDAINKFIEWCRKGPERAVVAEVQVARSSPEQFPDFTVKRD